jgi:polysaccharide pyruvyl transferase WcaK-like protein
VDAAYDRYIKALANAVDGFRQRRNVFVVLAATERLDSDACERIAAHLNGAPIFSSREYDIYQLVSILRACHLMASSRYHGIVTSMPGLVPSAGITMDERIRNLMRERGHSDLLLEVDDPELESKLGVVLDKLCRERERVVDGIATTVVRNLKSMAAMGLYFEQHVRQRYPEFPVPTGKVTWEDYLPPISAGLRQLVETHPAA